jgi:hypothetical protein
VKPRLPCVEVAAVPGQAAGSRGSIITLLKVTALESLALRSYDLLGPACIHVSDEPHPADLKMTDDLIAQAQRIAKRLAIPLVIDRDAIADLLYAHTCGNLERSR